MYSNSCGIVCCQKANQQGSPLRKGERANENDIVMKTGTHPFISKLKLFFKWGISFPENSYTIADKGARCVHYISRETLIKNITARYPQEKKPRVPASNLPSGGQSMTEPAEATFAQEVDHAAQQEKIAKPIRTG